MSESDRGEINCYYMCKCQSALEDENGKHPIDGEFNFIIAIGDDLKLDAISLLSCKN